MDDRAGAVLLPCDACLSICPANIAVDVSLWPLLRQIEALLHTRVDRLQMASC